MLLLLNELVRLIINLANSDTELTSFPIALNEAFIFGSNEKCGVELEFKHR